MLRPDEKRPRPGGDCGVQTCAVIRYEEQVVLATDDCRRGIPSVTVFVGGSKLYQ